MRLTLRTLMAYLDNILEPADRAEVGKKLAESESAQGVLNHIRDVTHRVRLGTPKLNAKGLGGDPNTVAEYLDHSMHNERVQEFEKVCLESDVQLAELADCHQILALVLGQQAEVDRDSRRKMYAMGARSNETGEVAPVSAATSGPSATVNAAPATAEAVAATVAAHASTSAPTTATSERAHVPDYLLADRKAAKRNQWIMIAASLLLLLGIARIVAPFDASHPFVSWMGTPQENPTPKPNNTIAPIDADNPSGPNEKAGEKGLPATVIPPVEPNATPVTPAENPVVPAPSVAGLPGTTPPVAIPAASMPTTPNPAATLPADKIAGEVAPLAGTSPPPLPTPANQTNPAAVPAPPVVVAPGDPVGVGATVSTVPVNPATPVVPVAAGTPPAVPASPAPGGLVGRMTQDGSQVLLSWKDTTDGGSWVRTLGGGTIGSGDRLLSLHTYRPSVVLKNGVGLQLVGETQVEIYNTAQEEVPLIRVHFGKIVLANNGRANAKIAIEPGVKRTGILTLNDPESVAALEVVRALPLGGNPESVPAQVLAVLYGVNGRYQWQADSAVPAPAPLAAPQRQSLSGDTTSPLTATETKLPIWISKNELSGYDSQATVPLQQLLSDGQPIAVTLRELVGSNRRAEIRYLAARSLALIDEFDLFIDSFSDPDQKAVWSKEIEALQAALARGPETAALVRQAFMKQRPDYGEQLYRYLWGCTREDLVAGYADELLNGLDHENLDMRVVSYHTLREAVRDPKSTAAPPTYNYVPDATSIAARQQAARQWRQNVKELVKRLPAPAPAAGTPAPVAPATLDMLP